MANPYALDFSPVTNALAGWQKQRNADRQFEAENYLANEHLGIQKKSAARAQAEYDRQNAVRGAVTNWLASNPNVGGVPQPIVDLARIQGDASPVKEYLLADARRKAELAAAPAPSNVREWQYFSRLPPEEQQRYITMKRAEKYLDLGTHYQRPNPVDPSQPGPTYEKDIVGKERAEEIGKAQGKATADFPRILDNSSQALHLIEQIRQHPGKQYGVGAIGGSLPPVPGTAQAGFVDLVAQAKGKAFLEAFNSLKGGGQITEVEGQKATEAIARLNRARRPEDFEAALTDFEDVIRAGVDRARKAAGGAPASSGFSIRRLD